MELISFTDEVDEGGSFGFYVPQGVEVDKPYFFRVFMHGAEKGLPAEDFVAKARVEDTGYVRLHPPVPPGRYRIRVDLIALPEGDPVARQATIEAERREAEQRKLEAAAQRAEQDEEEMGAHDEDLDDEEGGAPLAAFDLWIDVGEADSADLAELFTALSDLHRAAGGTGLQFRVDGLGVSASAEGVR